MGGSKLKFVDAIRGCGRDLRAYRPSSSTTASCPGTEARLAEHGLTLHYLTTWADCHRRGPPRRRFRRGDPSPRSRDSFEDPDTWRGRPRPFLTRSAHAPAWGVANPTHSCYALPPDEGRRRGRKPPYLVGTKKKTAHGLLTAFGD